MLSRVLSLASPQVFDYPSVSEISLYLATEGHGSRVAASEESHSPASPTPLGQGKATHAVHAALRRRLPLLRGGPLDQDATHVLALDPGVDVLTQVRIQG